MLDLPGARAFLQGVAAARIDGDVDALVDLFHEDATLQIVGVGVVAKGRQALRAQVESLVAEFEFLEWQPRETIVSGETIAARHRLKVRHRPSGRIAETETADFLTMKDGRCLAFTQFTDTALVAELSRPA